MFLLRTLFYELSNPNMHRTPILTLYTYINTLKSGPSTYNIVHYRIASYAVIYTIDDLCLQQNVHYASLCLGII